MGSGFESLAPHHPDIRTIPPSRAGLAWRSRPTCCIRAMRLTRILPPARPSDACGMAGWRQRVRPGLRLPRVAELDPGFAELAAQRLIDAHHTELG